MTSENLLEDTLLTKSGHKHKKWLQYWICGSNCQNGTYVLILLFKK